MGIDWKWLIIGLFMGWMVLPRVQAALFVHKTPAVAA